MTAILCLVNRLTDTSDGNDLLDFHWSIQGFLNDLKCSGGCCINIRLKSVSKQNRKRVVLLARITLQKKTMGLSLIMSAQFNEQIFIILNFITVCLLRANL